MKLEPMGERVLVKIVEPEMKTASGIYIPSTAQEKPQQGIIVAIGNEVDEDSGLKEGDKILFAKYSGTEVKLDGVDHLVLDVSDILAKILED